MNGFNELSIYKWESYLLSYLKLKSSILKIRQYIQLESIITMIIQYNHVVLVLANDFQLKIAITGFRRPKMTYNMACQAGLNVQRGTDHLDQLGTDKISPSADILSTRR